jgi:hypothetical protein
MTMTTISEQLKIAALKAGMHDTDDLALADLSKDDGTATAADALITELRRDKPFLFAAKLMKDMTPAEQDAWWKEHKQRTAKAGRAEALAEFRRRDKMAKDMTPAEQDAFLKEVTRRLG